MTRKDIEERLATLRAEREQILMTLGAYNGAIQENERWLSLLPPEEPPPTIQPADGVA